MAEVKFLKRTQKPSTLPPDSVSFFLTNNELGISVATTEGGVKTLTPSLYTVQTKDNIPSLDLPESSIVVTSKSNPGQYATEPSAFLVKNGKKYQIQLSKADNQHSYEFQEQLDKRLEGVGRPDKPNTTRSMKSNVEAAPIGSIYTSTNGAGVGAWTWLKTGNGWETTYADTGWRRVLTELPNTENVRGLDLRRINNIIYARIAPIDNTSGFTLVSKETKTKVDINFPVGFRLEARTTTAIYCDEGIAGYVMIRKGDGGSSYGSADFYLTSSVNNTLRCAWASQWTATESWPTTLPGTAV